MTSVKCAGKLPANPEDSFQRAFPHCPGPCPAEAPWRPASEFHSGHFLGLAPKSPALAALARAAWRQNLQKPAVGFGKAPGASQELLIPWKPLLEAVPGMLDAGCCFET